MKIKSVIFDLDGTLLDTREGIVESVKHTIEVMGYKKLDYQTMLTFVGPPIQKSFIDHYGCSLEEAQKAAEIFRENYKDFHLLKAHPYSGIYELCDYLKSKGIKMAVATYKREDYAITLLKRFGLDKYCSAMHGADNMNVLKKEDIIKMCCDEMGLDKNDCVLIGDTKNDESGAENFGVKFIAVTYGFGFKNSDELNNINAIGIAHNPLDIKRFIM